MSRRVLGLSIACLAVAGSQLVLAQTDEAERVRKSATVLEEIMDAPDKAIPAPVLKKAEAVVVFPGTLKGGLGVGAHHGRGIISVRHHDRGKWSDPGFLSMNRDGVEKLLKNEFKIGGDASVAAGPVGRGTEASTDIQLTAEILSYSRARGLFAGVSLEGSSIREDEDANRRYYGRPLHNRDIVLAKTVVGTSGSTRPEPDTWFRVLNRYAK